MLFGVTILLLWVWLARTILKLHILFFVFNQVISGS